MGNFSPDQINALERLINYTNTAEGSVLPPQLVGGVRIPSVTNLQVAKTVPAVGGSLCTLTWTDVEDGRNLVDHYDISALGLLNGNVQPLNLVHSDNSPCSLTIQGDKAQPVVFVVQTVLKNGMTSEFSQSPSCGCFCAAPLITTQFIGKNQVGGFNVSNANATNLIDDPGFESGDIGLWRKVGHILGVGGFIDPPAVMDSGWSIVNDSSNALNGTWVAKHVPSSYANDDLVTIGQIQCLPNDVFFVSGNVKNSAGADGAMQIGIQYYDTNKSQVSNSVLAMNSGTSYTFNSFLAASGGGSGTTAGVNARIVLDCANHTTGTWYVDDISVYLANEGTFATKSKLAQSGSIGTTVIVSGATAGLLRVSFYLATNTAGTGNVFATLGWSDSIGAKTLVTPTLTLTAGALAQTSFFIQNTTGNVTYTTTYAATGKYDLYISVERIGPTP